MLSSEDQFRLHVLLANELHALRIDESSMTVHGLSPDGESSVPLNPNCRDEIYLRRVRELISTQVLGSPGGYPVYLRRWTRMGQTRDTNLEKLLLLGEPEAVVAVVNAHALNEELARRAWWAMPCADNAREMLAREQVADTPLARELAEYLIEFLPFETDHRAMIESIRLVLLRGQPTPALIQRLWAKTKHKQSYLVGFLQAMPDALPEQRPTHPQFEALRKAYTGLEDNPCAAQLLRLLDGPGQTYLHTVSLALGKPNNQDVVVALLETVRSYLAAVCINLADPRDEVTELDAQVAALCDGDTTSCHGHAARQLLERAPWSRPLLESMLWLSGIGVRLVTPIFARTDAIGSVMRRKIEPVTIPIESHLQRLQRPLDTGQ